MKFKVGDYVKVPRYSHRNGQIGNILGISDEFAHVIWPDGNSYYYVLQDLRLSNGIDRVLDEIV